MEPTIRWTLLAHCGPDLEAMSGLCRLGQSAAFGWLWCVWEKGGGGAAKSLKHIWTMRVPALGRLQWHAGCLVHSREQKLLAPASGYHGFLPKPPHTTHDVDRPPTGVVGAWNTPSVPRAC